MQFELNYQMPYRRLAKLSRSMSFNVLRTAYLLAGLLLAALAAAVAGICIYADALDEWMLSVVGIPRPYGGLLAFAGVVVFWLAGIVLMCRFQRNLVKSRPGVDFDRTVRLTKDDGGLRFATDGIEYYLKWPGISQMLMERDGVVVSYGHMFWLVPDAAFPDAGTRLAFIRDVYGHLTEKARSISEKYIRPVLGPNP
jgi:hypothetical protein